MQFQFRLKDRIVIVYKLFSDFIHVNRKNNKNLITFNKQNLLLNFYINISI